MVGNINSFKESQVKKINKTKVYFGVTDYFQTKCTKGSLMSIFKHFFFSLSSLCLFSNFHHFFYPDNLLRWLSKCIDHN